MDKNHKNLVYEMGKLRQSIDCYQCFNDWCVYMSSSTCKETMESLEDILTQFGHSSNLNVLLPMSFFQHSIRKILLWMCLFA